MKFLKYILLAILLLSLCLAGFGFNNNNAVRGLGALFIYSIMPQGWLPPLTYDWYFIGEAGITNQTPVSVVKYLHRYGKKVGAKIYQEAHPWPETHRIDMVMSAYGGYLDFITISEENETWQIEELNNTYDYIKEHYPRIKVYQWLQATFNFKRLGELKADGFVINPRWWWSKEYPLGSDGRNYYGGDGFEERYLNYILADGRPTIDLLFIGAMADLEPTVPQTSWEYAIGQYVACQKNGIRIGIIEPFHPAYESVVNERFAEIINYWFKISGQTSSRRIK